MSGFSTSRVRQRAPLKSIPASSATGFALFRRNHYQECVAALEKIRLFVAVFPPPEVAHRLAGAAFDLARELSPKAVAWTRPEQIHVTLNFLGHVEPDKAPEFEIALDAACRRGQGHLLRARGLGCFPSPARPRIIWAGLAGAVSVLEGLNRALNENLAPLGYAPESRPFQPHLTIGRVKLLNGRDRQGLAANWPRWRETDFGAWPVERVDLMQSVLGPAGARYSRVRSFPLAGAAGARGF